MFGVRSVEWEEVFLYSPHIPLETRYFKAQHRHGLLLTPTQCCPPVGQDDTVSCRSLKSCTCCVTFHLQLLAWQSASSPAVPTHPSILSPLLCITLPGMGHSSALCCVALQLQEAKCHSRLPWSMAACVWGIHRPGHRPGSHVTASREGLSKKIQHWDDIWQLTLVSNDDRIVWGEVNT